MGIATQVSQTLTIEEALTRAKKAAKQGKNDVAARLFAAVLKQNPNHPVARKGLRKLQKNRRAGAVHKVRARTRSMRLSLFTAPVASKRWSYPAESCSTLYRIQSSC